MNRPIELFPHSQTTPFRSAGYTLIEILVATTLSLLLMGAVIRMFGDVGESMTESRSMLEAAEHLRLAATRLQQDLGGVTVTMDPPRKPENNEGYFEYIEGPVSQVTAANTYAINSDVITTPVTTDTTVGDFDDILMFTTRSTCSPFVGKFGNTTIESNVAEVAWFLRGRTLHRRVLLVAPSATPPACSDTYYANNDISARVQGNNIIFNTLGDLTRREYRFAHARGANTIFPYSIAGHYDPTTNVWTHDNWYWTLGLGSGTLTVPTLPTLQECCVFMAGTRTSQPTSTESNYTTTNPKTFSTVDFWSNNPRLRPSDYMFTASTNTVSRMADDIILTNVVGFDVKAWDPTAVVFQQTNDGVNYTLIYPGDSAYSAANKNIKSPTSTYPYTNPIDGKAYTVTYAFTGAYVDLGYGNTDYTSSLANGLAHFGRPKSLLYGSPTTARIYDTWSTHYESENVNGLTGGTNTVGRSVDGFSDNGTIDYKNTSPEVGTDGIIIVVPIGDPAIPRAVDDDYEKLTAPPYPIPLRGVQVKIRIFDPDSKQIREVTVVQDFLPQ